MPGRFSDEQVAGIKAAVCGFLAEGATFTAARLMLDGAGYLTPALRTMHNWRAADPKWDKACYEAIEFGMRKIYDVGLQQVTTAVLPAATKNGTLFIWAMVNLCNAMARRGIDMPVRFESINTKSLFDGLANSKSAKNVSVTVSVVNDGKKQEASSGELARRGRKLEDD